MGQHSCRYLWLECVTNRRCRRQKLTNAFGTAGRLVKVSSSVVGTGFLSTMRRSLLGFPLILVASFLSLSKSLVSSNTTTPRGPSQHHQLSRSSRSSRSIAKWYLYYSNPRAASLFLSDRIVIFGSGQYDIEPREAKDFLFRVMFKRRRTKSGALVGAKIMFLVPSAVSDAISALSAVTPNSTMISPNARREFLLDRRVVPVLVADEFCEADLPDRAHLTSWAAPALRQYWSDNASSPHALGLERRLRATPSSPDRTAHARQNTAHLAWYIPLGPRFEFPLIQEKVKN
jgi:hypothetical protein